MKRVALAVAAVLVGVSGCGRGHGPLLRAPLPTPPSRPKRGGSTLVLGAWTMVDLGSDGRTIRVADATGDCLDFDHTDVKESTVDVHVTVWNRRWASGRNEDCTLELRGGPYTIELPRPLNGRQVTGQCQPDPSTIGGRQCEAMVSMADVFRQHSAR